MHSLLFVFFLFLHLLSPASSDLSSDGAALLTFRSAVGRSVLPWNASSSPCQWKGVTCSGNRIATLRLPAAGLTGQIPAGTIGNLTELRVISLRHNALSGPLPSDLARCTRLRVVHLKQNHFSGEFPSSLPSLPGLARLNLAENNFSGEIPSSLNNLKRLTALYLENNDFAGEMPDLDIPKLAQFNVSFNRLNGSVPAKLIGMPVESFLGTSMCGGPLNSCPGNSHNLSSGAIAGIAIAAVFLLLLILVIPFLFKRGGSRSPEIIHPLPEPNIETKTTEKQGTAPNLLVLFPGAPRVFDLEGLLRAPAEVLGKGKFGTTYKAEMETDLVVAVKRFEDLVTEKRVFVKKIEAIGAAKHPNLVPLLAYYYSKKEKLLVYDYMPNGDLHSVLHGAGRTDLNWETRVKIALDAARGIEHVHSISPSSAHGNIKSSNILITGSFGSRIADHGVAQFARRVAPEDDVFGFGVVLLEMVTGKAPGTGGVGLRRWAESGNRGELFDAGLVRSGRTEEEMGMLLEVGVDCCEELPENRPAMAAVVARIEGIWRNGKRKEILDA